jgi:hypothetical protein
VKLKELDNLANELKDLKEDYKNNASFLNGYDKQNYLNLIEDLNKYINEIKEKINPRKKFAFSNKSGVTKPAEKNIINDVSSLKSSTIQNIKIEDESTEFILKDKIYENTEKIIITKEEVENKNNLIIENISNCEIYILYSFKACYIKNINSCKLFIGSVGGGTHITSCNDCNIYLSTHQLRIHQTHRTVFNVIVTSNPIIEDCSELVFMPLNIIYKSFEENLEVIIKLTGIIIYY